MRNPHVASGHLRYAPLVNLAATQHGVLSGRAACATAGLTEARSWKWVQRGVLHVLHPGVYAYGHPAVSKEGRWLAAVFAGGHGAALGYLHAPALMLDLRRFPLGDPVVLTPRRHRPVPGVELHWCRHLDPRDVTTCKGIPVTTIARALVDLTDVLTAHQLAYVIKEAAYRKRFDLAATRRAMDRANGRRNLHVLEEGDRALRARQRRHEEPTRGRVPGARHADASRAAGQHAARRLRSRLPLARSDARRRDRRRRTRSSARATQGRRRGPRAAQRGLHGLRFTDTHLSQNPADVLAHVREALNGYAAARTSPSK